MKSLTGMSEGGLKDSGVMLEGEENCRDEC